MTLPKDWKHVALGDLLTEEQMRRLAEPGLTAAKIKDIVHADTSKMQGIADPDYLTYALMYRLGVPS
jgi:hypothetical protein